MRLTTILFKLITAAIGVLLLSACSQTAYYQQSAFDKRQTLHLNHYHSVQYYQTQFKGLWARVRAGFQLNHHINQPLVKHYLYNDSHYPARIYQSMLRAKPFLYEIINQLNIRHMPTELALLPIIESRYDPQAISNAGAMGIWQLMPVTANRFHVRKSTWWYNGRQSIFQSTQAALNYLHKLYQLFDHNWLLAIAAYNSGEGTVEGAIDYNARHQLPTDFWHLNLPEQTKQYVPKLLALAAVVDQPSRYHFKLPYIANKPVIGQIRINHQIDLDIAASLANIPTEEIYKLNPEYTRRATPPHGYYHLVLPIYHIDTFWRNYANFPKQDLIQWRRYIVKKGQTLSQIAWLTGASMESIRLANHLYKNRIYAGQSLLYPISKSNRHYHHYRVKEGENLTLIGHKFGVTAKQIAHWNQMNPNALIYPGQVLVIR